MPTDELKWHQRRSTAASRYFISITTYHNKSCKQALGWITLQLWAHPWPRLGCATAAAAVSLDLFTSPRPRAEPRKGLGCFSPGLAESLLDGLFDGLALGSALLGTGHCYQHPAAQAQPQSTVWERMGILLVALLGEVRC